MQPDDAEKLDRLLDQALAQYGSTGPRTGLETRIQATLRSEQARIAAGRRWQWWALGLAATAAVVAIVWWGALSSRPARSPEIANHKPAQVVAPAPKHESPSALPQTVAQHKRMARPPATGQRVEPVVANAGPVRGQFPTPTPLSPEEQLLARYVSEFRQDAARTAQAQTALQKADELAWTTPPDVPIR